MDGNMNRVLRRVAMVMGFVLLAISIYWSQDGFNFTVAGDSGGTNMAIMFGYAIAVAVTIVQFVFSTNFKELNASLIVFGLLAYVYSIYTNWQGIMHFQGEQPNNIMALVLGFAMDGVPEPLIAWGLKESLTGDFVGNLLKGFGAFMTGQPIGGKQNSQQQGGGEGRRKEDNRGGSGGEKKHIPFPPNMPRDQRHAQLRVAKPNGDGGNSSQSRN